MNVQNQSKRKKLAELKNGFVNEWALKHLIEFMPGHVYWKNRKGQFLGCNKLQAQSIGMSMDEIIGKTAKDTMPPDLAKIVLTVDKRVMEDGETVSVEELGELSDGSIGVFLSKKIPIFDEKNKIIGLLGVSFDISERKKIENQLAEAKVDLERALRYNQKFLKFVSGELREPLNHISGVLSLISRKNLTKQERDLVYDALSACENIMSIFNGIKDYMEIKQDYVLKEESISPIEIVESVKANAQQYSNHKKSVVTIHWTDKVPSRVILDSYLLWQVVNYMLINAIRFTTNGIVEIFLDVKETNLLSIQIKDYGPGIPKEIIQLLSQEAEFIPGKSGIKLALTKKTLEMLNGDFYINSNKRGTTITIEVPYKKVADKKIISAKPTKQKKVLVVEDDLVSGKILKYLLEQLHYSVDIATCQKDLDKIKYENYKMVFLDMHLQETNGFEIAEIIMKLRKVKPKIIVVSSQIDDVYENRLSSLGVQCIMKKPINFDDLENVCARFSG